MKIFKGIISTILTLIVIPILMAFIVYLSANSILTKKNIEKMVKEVSVSNFLVDENGEYNELGKGIKDSLVENGLPAEVVDEFVNSKEITDFFSEYAGEITDYIVRDKEIEQLSAEDISKFINDNIDSIINELIEKKVEGYEELTDERVAEFKSKVGEISKEIEKNLPDLEEAMNDSEAKDVFGILRLIFSNLVFTIILCVIATLLIFILLLNLKNYSLLIWFGIIFVIASVPFVALCSIIPTLTTDIDSKAVIDIIEFIFGKLNMYSLIFFVTGAVFITVAVVLRTIDRVNNIKQG